MALLPRDEQRGDNRAAANEKSPGEQRWRTRLRADLVRRRSGGRLLVTDVIILHSSERDRFGVRCASALVCV